MEAATIDEVHNLSCVNCGKTFQAKRADALYCSPKCRVAHHRKEQGLGQIRAKKVRRRCDQCSKSYWTNQPDRSRFCSDACRSQWHYEQRRGSNL